MLKKLICLCLLMVMGVMVLGCGEDPILKQFDLSDPKIYWEGTTVDDLQSGGPYNMPASDAMIYVTFRKTSTYPKLKIEDFRLKNAESIYYLLLNPPEFDDEHWEENNIEDYRQYAAIYLKEYGHEKVLEAVRHIEKLKFVKYVRPAFPNIKADVSKYGQQFNINF